MGAALGLLGGLGGAATGSGMLSTVLGIGGELMSAMGASQAASAQADYQQKLSEQRRDENYEKQVVERQKEAMDSEKISREKAKAQREHRASVSTAQTSAAGAGVSGLSVDALLRDYNVQSSMQLESIERQRQFSEIVTETNVENIAKNQYIPGPVESPSMGTAFLGIASSLFTPSK